MTAVAKPLHLRLFLEGVEVPVISAQVSTNINAPAAASVQVIPLDEGLLLKPRTMVHLFYLDMRSRIDGGKITGTIGDYKLLFSGELIGLSMVQSPQSRALVLQCVDFSSYWDAAHATALEYGLGGNALTDTGAIYASNVGTFDDIVSQQANKLVSWLGQRPQTPGLQSVSGLAGGIIRMLEGVGGVPNLHKGVNDFFTVAELRCRLLSQITAEENDNTAHNLLSQTVFDEWIRTGLQNIGQQVTFRDMMKLLFQYIYYEVCPNPSAMFVPEAKGGEDEIIKGRPMDVKAAPAMRRALKTLEDQLKDLDAKIASADADPSDSAHYAAGVSKKIADLLADLTRLTSSNPGVTRAVSDGKSALSRAKITFDALAVKASESWNNFIPARDQLQTARTSLDGAKGQIVTADRTISKATSQRLRTQIIRPDCWFAPPPVCNVMFPEQYTQISFDRNFIQEVTRSLVLLYPSLVGQDMLLSTRILAPNVGMKAGSVRWIGEREDSYRILMEHELHTGIIARQEWLPNTAAVSKDNGSTDKMKVDGHRKSWAARVALFHFFKYRFAPRTLNLGGRFNPNVVCGFPGAVIRAPYMPLALTTMDAQQRETDMMQAAMDNARELGAPAHFVGMVSSVTHSIDQNGGNTSVSMHHVRQHLGTDDEFLRVTQTVENASVDRIVRVVLRESELKDPKLRKLLAAVTPQGAVPRKQSSVTKTSTAQATSQAPVREIDPSTGTVTEQAKTDTHVVVKETAAEAPPSAPPLTQRSTIHDVGEDILVPFPAGSVKAGDVGKGFFPKSKILAVEVRAGGAYGQFAEGRMFKEVILHERVNVAVTGAIAAEEVIRPRGWFSPKYENVSIGQKIYAPFFGCFSVIDGLGASLGTTKLGFEGQSSAATDPVNASSSDPAARLAILSGAETEKLKYTTERALNAVAYSYGRVKAAGLDVDEFITQYTDRSIATMRQVLGDLSALKFEIAKDGRVKTLPAKDGSTPFIGFHTMAIHPQLVQQSKLAGLVEDPTLQLQRMNGTGEASSILPGYDVRNEKYAQVAAYSAALVSNRAFRG